jgi:hypothetical protein
VHNLVDRIFFVIIQSFLLGGEKMSSPEKREISLVETRVCLAPDVFKKYYGIKVKDETYQFERQCITTNSSYVDFLIYKILTNDVDNVHIEDIVEDFIYENDLK